MSRINRGEAIISVLTCSVCGENMYVPRRGNKLRSKNHVKTMWCPKCQKKTDFIEDGTTL